MLLVALCIINKDVTSMISWDVSKRVYLVCINMRDGEVLLELMCMFVRP